MAPNERVAPQTVLLVHGTGAGSPADEGPAWWQRGSDTWSRLRALLLPSAALESVFHWDGANSQRSRRRAASALRDRLAELEQQGRDYHLVGHSHGGSVIWECLQQAILSRQGHGVQARDRALSKLPGLRSWTTVGTPFLRFDLSVSGRRTLHERVEAFNARLLGGRIVDGCHAILALVMLLAFVAIFPVFSVLLFVLAIQDGEPLYLFGIPVLALMLLAFGLLYVGWNEGMIERAAFHRERVARGAALVEFGPRWLGLYSTDDEAINGLKAALNMRGNIVPRRQLPEAAFHADRVLRLVRPFLAVSNWMQKKVFAPLGDRYIARQLARRATGNDRPATLVVEVTPAPLPAPHRYPPLPAAISARLARNADHGAARIVPGLRAMLGELATCEFQLLESRALAGIAGDALVHTSYFSDDDVLQMIAWHIAKAGGVDASVRLDEASVRWLEAAKAEVARATSAELALPRLRGARQRAAVDPRPAG